MISASIRALVDYGEKLLINAVAKITNILLSFFGLRLGWVAQMPSAQEVSSLRKENKLLRLENECVSASLRVVEALAQTEGDLRSGLAVAQESKSQLGQEAFVLIANAFSDHGYFVEIGATSGELLSNTWLLESKYGWDGILVEPEPSWHAALHSNRSASIDHRAVWSRTGDCLPFVSDGVLSSLEGRANLDMHQRLGSLIEVETVTLKDLLTFHNAPRTINFISIDTEGSEWDIIKDFPFVDYDIRTLCVEHNYSAAQAKIKDKLVSMGFIQVSPGLSRFDSWFVSSSVSKRVLQ